MIAIRLPQLSAPHENSFYIFNYTEIKYVRSWFDNGGRVGMVIYFLDGTDIKVDCTEKYYLDALKEAGVTIAGFTNY